jgi:hypothetical protein
MRNRILLALLPAGTIALLWACSGGITATSPGTDSGADADAGDDADSGLLDDLGGGPDGNTSSCTLSDGTTDPVALCVEEQIITQELQYAYVKGKGVAPGWSSMAPYTALPRTASSWQDDLALAGAMGAFYCSAEVYGNNHLDSTLAGALNDLGGVLVPELQQALLTGYDGEVYFRLRWAQAAYNYASDATATKLESMANTYAASIAGQVYPVPAAGDGGSAGGMVIGVQNGDGTVTYSPAQAVMAAAALLDMAVLDVTGADAGAASPAWANLARQVLAYVLARGRDPVSGLFYQSLTTSGDPGHDTVGAGSPTNDSMLTETQAWTILGLARAQDLITTFETDAPDAAGAGNPDAAGPVGPVYYQAVIALAGAMSTDGLFDGTMAPPPAPAIQPVGALMEGLILSGQQLLTNKTTIGNVIYLGGLHRVAVGAGVPQSYQLGQIRSALGWSPPGTLQLANTSLLTIVTDTSGDLLQQTYLRAGSKTFHFAQAYSPGGEPVAQGQEPGATNYLTAANHAMVEGFTQLWYGAANDPRCAP